MLSKIKTNTKWYHLYVKSLKKKKKPNFIGKENRMVVTREWGRREEGDTRQWAQIYSYKKNKL